MQKKLHQGEFIKGVLDEHDKILARIAEKASMSPQNLQSVFKRMRVDEDIVERLGAASKLDLVGMLRAAGDKLSGRAKPSPINVAEPPAEYKALPPQSGQPVVIVLSPGDPAYAEVIKKLIEKNG